MKLLTDDMKVFATEIIAVSRGGVLARFEGKPVVAPSREEAEAFCVRFMPYAHLAEDQNALSKLVTKALTEE